jgi:hypothetical protein
MFAGEERSYPNIKEKRQSLYQTQNKFTDPFIAYHLAYVSLSPTTTISFISPNARVIAGNHAFHPKQGANKHHQEAKD